MAEASYTPDTVRAVEAQPRGIPPLDVWMMEQINEAKTHLAEGQRLDPWYASELLTDYKEKIIRAEMDVRGVDTASEAIGTEVSQEQALYASVQRVHNAYDITSYASYDENHQRLLSSEVYGMRVPYIPASKSQEPFTLTPGEKGTLQKITSAVGVPDNPQQFTYSFASLPPVQRIVRGSVQQNS